MHKMNRVQKIGLALAFCAMAGVSHAEGTADAASFITTAQTTLTTLIGALVAAALLIYAALLGYRAIGWVYSKVAAWYSGRK